ncbi:hypothetical protein DFH29DRAFT_242009 [Suillus ampliporus]|nr:hypothetical protein DFH29DRAFT_242009 [Suillus ampliporus]
MTSQKSSISTLEMRNVFRMFFHAFHSAKLTILSLSFDTYYEDDIDFLTLERLQGLQITVLWSSRCNLNFLDAVPLEVEITLPFPFQGYEHRPLHRVPQMVLDRCPALEHLALFPPMPENRNLGSIHEPLLGMQHIQILLDHCSTLDASLSPMPGKSLSHKNLRWINIWASWHPSAPDPDVIQVSWKPQCFPQLQAIRLLDWALLNATGLRLNPVIPPHSVQHHETLLWRFPGVHVQDAAGHIYRRDMDYVSSFAATCDDHGSFRGIDNGGVDSMPGDSDSDSDDGTFGSVSLVSYSAYDSEEGDLKTLEDYFPFLYYDDPEEISEDVYF